MDRLLYLDCLSGISGDMTVGALCDLGVEPETLRSELGKLSLGETRFDFERQTRQGINGTKFIVREHGHAHGRRWAEIREMIGSSALSDFVRQKTLAVFERVALAEAKIHGVPLETVGFHEVGAIDSIADIVGACIALEALGRPRVIVSPLREGRGWIDCAHGRFPLPAPATLEILRGVELELVDESWESITPTGAAIAREFAQSFGLMPRMEIEKIGYGIGTRELKERPNVLRAVLGRVTEVASNDYETDTIIEIETNIDDLSPEITGAVMERLLALGALDVTLTPVQMKKNRPGVQLAVLCEPALEAKVVHTLLTETSAFGVRRSEKRRFKLERRFEKVQTAFGEITLKLGLRKGEVVQVAPEFESCRAASERSGQPLREIYRAALAAHAKR
ncbi:MAG: nickel pincer cofactor biosynthesis protein LarC [Verrucomicrobiota bacterium]|nr:nickel pincer cofactor biosynthesis protein LarC [Chthoniobacterales bacterium]MDQ3547092.1 nickel pincer cofactor biosynthesis protein LarC [Verrucomicrobiota bacterium]